MQMVERRFFESQLRTESSSNVQFSSSPSVIVGYAALFSAGSTQRWSSDLGGFFERVSPNCFARSLRDGDVVHATFNHSVNYPLGSTKNKTLALKEDKTGLYMRCVLPPTSYARDLFSLVSRGDLTSQSFAFSQVEDDWDIEPHPETGERVKIRTLRSAKLHDVSVVLNPAYGGTSVEAVSTSRSLERFVPTFVDLFPTGVPIEVRGHVGDARALFDAVRDRRRRLVSSVLSY